MYLQLQTSVLKKRTERKAAFVALTVQSNSYSITVSSSKGHSERMSCHRAHMAEHLGGGLAFDIQRRVANEMS